MIKPKKVILKNEPKKRTLWDVSSLIKIYQNSESEYCPPVTSNISIGDLLVNSEEHIFLVTKAPSIQRDIDVVYFTARGRLVSSQIQPTHVLVFRKIPDHASYEINMSKDPDLRTTGSINITNLDDLLGTNVATMSIKDMLPERWYRDTDTGDYYKMNKIDSAYDVERLVINNYGVYSYTIVYKYTSENIPEYNLELMPEDYAIELTF